MDTDHLSINRMHIIPESSRTQASGICTVIREVLITNFLCCRETLQQKQHQEKWVSFGSQFQDLIHHGVKFMAKGASIWSY